MQIHAAHIFRVRFLRKRHLNRQTADLSDAEAQYKESAGTHIGLLIASGLVAGAAVTGVVLAIPFVIEDTSNALRIMPASMTIIPQLLSIFTMCWLFLWFKQRVIGSD